MKRLLLFCLMSMVLLSSGMTVTAQEKKAPDDDDYWVEWALAGSDLDGEPWRPGIDADTDLQVWHRPDDTADKVDPTLVEYNFLLFDEFLRRVQEMI